MEDIGVREILERVTRNVETRARLRLRERALAKSPYAVDERGNVVLIGGPSPHTSKYRSVAEILTEDQSVVVRTPGALTVLPDSEVPEDESGAP